MNCAGRHNNAAATGDRVRTGRAANKYGLVKEMIVIDRNRCCGCGHCAAIRITLKCIKDVDNIEYYEEPPEQDNDYIDRAIQECWSNCIDKRNY